MSIATLWESTVRGVVDESWIANNIYKDLVRICNKYNDDKWLCRGQHIYCIYYCCNMLGSLSNLSEEACIKIVNEPNCVETLLALWKGDKTWFESRCAARTISNIFAKSPLCMHRFCKNARNINIAELAMKQYTECVRFVIRHCTVAPQAAMKGYVTDLVLRSKGKSMSSEDSVIEMCTIECAQDWMIFIGQILVSIASSLNDDIINLFETVDVALWENAVAMDLCYYWPPSPNIDTFMGALIHLSGYKTYAKLISSSECIMKSLILSLRSRSDDVLKSRYDLILCNLLKFDVIPAQYYYDLTETLTTLLEVDRKHRSITLYQSHYGSTFIFESIIHCLQLLFGIPLGIRCLESKKTTNKFKCTSCHKWLNNPHKTVCKHQYCYICILKTKDDDEYAECVVSKCKNRKFKFTRKDERFDFKSWNAMNKLQIKMIMNDGKDTFVGEWNALWLFIKNNLDRNKRIHPLNLTQHFDYFCDFMIKERSVQSVQELKQLRLSARNRRLEGNKYFKIGQYDHAIAAYQDSLRLCPNKYTEDRATYFCNLGLSYFNSNSYFDAYKAALSGLALNIKHLKLNNVLSKCYSKTNVSQLFTPNIIHDTFDIFDDDLYLNKVHNVVRLNFYMTFKYTFLNKLWENRDDELIPMSQSEQTIAVKKSEEEDPTGIARHTTNKITEYIARKIHFTRFHFVSYCEQYEQYSKQREMAKKEAYQFLMHTLTHKDDKEAFVAISDLLEVIEEHFCIHKLGKMQQEMLVSGYAKRVIDDRMPAVIKRLIYTHIFEKPNFNYYKFTASSIRRMVHKSDDLTLSKESLVDGEYLDECYGVKLTDLDRSVDPEWGEIELSDYDSGIDEFRVHVDDQ
eukprot:136998_1